MAGAVAEGGDGVAHGDIKNSAALLGDLEEVRQKVDRYRERANLTDHLAVKRLEMQSLLCYQYVLPPSLL